MSYRGLGDSGETFDYFAKVGSGASAGAAAGGKAGVPGAIVGGFFGAVAAMKKYGATGGPGAGDPDPASEGNPLPCGVGPGAAAGNCCPPDWRVKGQRLNADGSTGITCSNGDLVTVKGTQVFSRVSRAELEGLFYTVGTVYEVTKSQEAAKLAAAKLAAARSAAQAKADAALRSPVTQEAVAVQSSNRAMVAVGLLLAAGVGTYLYTRRR